MGPAAGDEEVVLYGKLFVTVYPRQSPERPKSVIFVGPPVHWTLLCRKAIRTTWGKKSSENDSQLSNTRSPLWNVLGP